MGFIWFFTTGAKRRYVNFCLKLGAKTAQRTSYQNEQCFIVVGRIGPLNYLIFMYFVRIANVSLGAISIDIWSRFRFVNNKAVGLNIYIFHIVDWVESFHYILLSTDNTKFVCKNKKRNSGSCCGTPTNLSFLKGIHSSAMFIFKYLCC